MEKALGQNLGVDIMQRIHVLRSREFSLAPISIGTLAGWTTEDEIRNK